jgi:hypothetical protein
MTISFAHWIRVTCVVLMMPLLASAQSATDLYHPAELYLKLDDSFPKPISDTPSESVTAFIQSLVGEASFKSARAGFFRSKSDLSQVYQRHSNGRRYCSRFIYSSHSKRKRFKKQRRFERLVVQNCN